MPPVLIAVLVVFGLVIVYLVVVARRAGPRQVSALDLSRAIVVRRATRDDPGEGWSKLGSKTTARGLDVKFDHDDDPQAEASFFAEGAADESRNTLANRTTVRLGSVFETHHVHTRGYVFRVRLRGTGDVVRQGRAGADARPLERRAVLRPRGERRRHRRGRRWLDRVRVRRDPEGTETLRRLAL
jgi:hypothetical protein